MFWRVSCWLYQKVNLGKADVWRMVVSGSGKLLSTRLKLGFVDLTVLADCANFQRI